MASLALLRESGGELGERHLRLGAAVKVAQGGEAALELVLAEKNGGACTELVGALHAPRDIAMKAELDGDAGMAQIPRKAQRRRLGLGADRHDRHRPSRRRASAGRPWSPRVRHSARLRAQRPERPGPWW